MPSWQQLFSSFSCILTTHHSQLTTFFLCLLCFFVAIFFLFFPAVTTHFHLRKSAKSADYFLPFSSWPKIFTSSDFESSCLCAFVATIFCDSTFAQNRSFLVDFDRKPLKIDRSAKMFFSILSQIATNRRILDVFRQKLTKGGNPVFHAN